MSAIKKHLQTVSKYRHATGKSGKKELWYTDLAASPSASDSSNSLSCSLRYVAFKNANGPGLNILDLLNGQGKQSSKLCTLDAGQVVDWQWSPFNASMLATGGEDCSVKVWQISADGKSSVKFILTGFDKRIESLHFHPAADNILAVVSASCVEIIQIDTQQFKFTLQHPDSVQSISWSGKGDRLVTSCKDGLIRVWDPRKSFAEPIHSFKGHAGMKASRVIWLGEKDMLFSTGFTSSRQREYALHQVKDQEVVTLVRSQMESSSSILMPLYDPDTEIIYMAGKGETQVRWLLVSDDVPYLTAGTTAICASPFSGMTLVPKYCLQIMEAEVARVLCLTSNDIVPVSFNVPRKSYRDFHDDLFPDTAGDVCAMSAEAWLNGVDDRVKHVSLNPAHSNLITAGQFAQDTLSKPLAKTSISEKSPEVAPQPLLQVVTAKITTKDIPKLAETEPEPSSPTKAPVVLAGLRSSSYRYISGKPMHVRENFEDIQALNYGLSGESNVLEINDKFIAFPLSGAGGRVAVQRMNQPRRFPPVIPATNSGADICDFALSKLNSNLLATATEDAKVKIWSIPEEGVVQDMTTPAMTLSNHLNRVNLVQFHPYSANVLLTASPELQGIGGQLPSVRLWDLEAQKERRALEGFTDLIQGAAWNVENSGLLAVSCKDRDIRLYDQRQSSAVQTIKSNEGVRACRIFWVGEHHMVSVGFGKSSQRECNLYDIRSRDEKPLSTLQLDVSPAILVPHYDEDLKIMFLAGRGATSILPVEIVLGHNEPFFALPRFESPGASIQQGIAFMPKSKLDIANIEVAKCWRLNQTNIEPISFTVPRNRREFFQDDIFTPTRDWSNATMTSTQWFDGVTPAPPKATVDLQPSGSIKLSQAPVEQKVASKYTVATGTKPLTDSQKQQQFLDNLFQSAQDESSHEPLKQDLMEGCDSDEWDE